MDDPDQTDGLVMNSDAVQAAKGYFTEVKVFKMSMTNAEIALDYMKIRLKHQYQQRVAARFVAHRLGRN